MFSFQNFKACHCEEREARRSNLRAEIATPAFGGLAMTV